MTKAEAWFTIGGWLVAAVIAAWHWRDALGRVLFGRDDSVIDMVEIDEVWQVTDELTYSRASYDEWVAAVDRLNVVDLERHRSSR